MLIVYSMTFFLGYLTPPGGRWNGEYLVADLDDFVGKDLRVAANPKQWPRFSPHITKVVKYGIQGIHFPCKPKFRRVNTTLDGAEEAGAIFDPWYNAIWPEDSEEHQSVQPGLDRRGGAGT